MKPEEATPPAEQSLEWNIKDSCRVWWKIMAKFLGTEISETEQDFYQSNWDVKIVSEGFDPDFVIQLIVSTQYDETPHLSAIWNKFQSEANRLTQAILTAPESAKKVQ